MINKELVKKIDTETIARYNARFKTFGPAVKTLGWDNAKNQRKRFESAIALLNLTGKSVVDIGCGFADFFKFIRDKKIKIASYRGVDINDSLLEIAGKRYPRAKFKKTNILTDAQRGKVADIGFALGLLNFNLHGKPNNYDYALEFIRKAFALCRETLVVDMLSDHLNSDYPKEGFVFYYSPERMFAEATKIAPYAILKHDYSSLPQSEFTLILKRKPCR